MRIILTIIFVILALVIGFVVPATMITIFRSVVYPELKEFDLGGLIASLIVGTVSAILCAVAVYKRMNRRD